MPVGLSPSLCLCLAMVYGGGPERPELVRDGSLSLKLPEGLLDVPEIRSQIDSGLTVTFAMRFRVMAEAGETVRGISVMTVRLEPWEEDYFVALQQGNDPLRQQVCRGWQAFRQFWENLRLVLVSDGSAAYRSGEVRLTMEIVPFSESERKQALDRVSGTEPTPFEVREVGARNGESTRVNELVNLIIFTSVKRKALLRFSWTLTF